MNDTIVRINNDNLEAKINNSIIEIQNTIADINEDANQKINNRKLNDLSQNNNLDLSLNKLPVNLINERLSTLIYIF